MTQWRSIGYRSSQIVRRINRLMATSTAAAVAIGSCGPAFSQSVLPAPVPASTQTVGLTAAQSGPPEWPQEPKAPKGAPNVLLILLDDNGFGAASTFGGLIPTPNFDALARNGARYNRFNTTALCSPTRAALLTGREEHNAGMGNVTNLPTGYEGYTTVIPKSAGIIAETLRQNGYSTATIGKWHLLPEWEMSPIGPFDRWPNGQGFEYSYSFLSGDTNQYAPSLYQNSIPVAPPTNDPGYILDHDLADHARQWIQIHHDLAPDKPWFLYYATGTAHAPHQAPKEWIAKFKGKFDQGWDIAREQIFARQKKMGVIPADAKLTPRPDFLPAWASLTRDQKRLYAHMMEVYAAAVAYADDQIGRVIDEVRSSGQFDNTLIIAIQGDNGSSAEGRLSGLFNEDMMINGYTEDQKYLMAHMDELGGPKAFNHYPAQWAWAMNTPFQYYKQVASHFGGTRNGMIVSWPGHVADPNVVRSQFAYVTDVVPTILEATGIQQPTILNGVKQKPLDGVSFAYTFKNPAAPERHTMQVFEMVQNLGIYKDGWWAGTRPVAAPWDVTLTRRSDLNARTWELYHVSQDFSQADDLARKYPAKLAEMKTLFFQRAAAMHILPIHSVGDGTAGRPSITNGRTDFTFHAGLTRIGESAAPRLIGRSWTITANVDIPPGGAQGVLIDQGGHSGGWALYVRNDRPVFHYNAMDEAHQYQIASEQQLTPGPHSITADFAADAPKPGTAGTLTLSVDGKQVASGRIERTHVTWISQSEGMDVGEDTLTPVNSDYTIATSKFTGSIADVQVHLK